MDTYFIKIIYASLFILFFIGGLIQALFIFIYLPRFEKKHKIQVLKPDFIFARINRMAMVGYLALINPKGRLFARFERQSKCHWYASQYLKLPREKFKPFLYSLYVSMVGIILMGVMLCFRF